MIPITPKRFTFEADGNGYVVRDTAGIYGGALEPVCRCNTVYQAQAITDSLNAHIGLQEDTEGKGGGA